jgi:DMSO reductase anchor subunit
MINRIRQTEWPLVVFTVAAQIATGLALAATVCDLVQETSGATRWLAIAVVPVVFLGAAASLAHLGRPWRGWRALLNIRRSPLSREVFASAAFLVAAACYSQSFLSGASQARTTLGVVTSILGIATVFLSSLVYLIPTQPGWNSWTVPLSFVSTAVLFGGVAARQTLRISDVLFARAVVDTVLVASTSLIVCALVAASRRATLRPLRFASKASTSTYCAVLCGTALWMAAEPAAAGTAWLIEAGFVVLLVVFVAVQRATMYRHDRLPQF